jgi:hypothetical protein
VHLTAYTVLKRQLPDCQGKFFESTGGQFLVSAEGVTLRHSRPMGVPLMSANLSRVAFASRNSGIS